MGDILLHLLVSLGYAALAFFLWRDALLPSPPQGGQSRARWAHAALIAPLSLHAWLLARAAFGPEGLYLGVGNAVSVIIWLTVLIYWAGSFFYRLEGLQVLVVPAAATLSLLPLALPPVHPLANTQFAAFKVHLVIALLAYSLFTIASLHVLMMAMMERRLHRGNLPRFLQGLPPLLTMEQLLFGILSWIIFAALLAGRALYGWRGRVAMRWTLAGFLSLVLAYIGSKFVLEVLLQR